MNRFILASLTFSILSACSTEKKEPQTVNNNTCPESGIYACETGESEPLYPFQWHLNYKNSYFSNFPNIWKASSDPMDYDLNIENAHKQGIKGQGVKVLVLDDGIDINHEDLKSNIDQNLTYNFNDGSSDPTPPKTDEYIDTSHGTNVAGIIAAAQNGKGVMGIAPRVTLGGANVLTTKDSFPDMEAYGGAEFSKNADIFSASYGANPVTPIGYDTPENTPVSLRALPKLRNNKGAIFIKASGNEFVDYGSEAGGTYRDCLNEFSFELPCENPAHDTDTLEPTVVVVNAVNAKGQRASYSNAGSISWISGLGGELQAAGIFGEKSNSFIMGPQIFSTDLQGCDRGYSRHGLDKDSSTLFLQGISTFKELKNNLFCNYSYMNGTSAATPTVSGVTALILQANPNLTWRDVREIIKRTARVIDPNYDQREETNLLVDLETGKYLKETDASNRIQDGMRRISLDYGWQKNGAGIKYSNWYGFGFIDAGAAVKLAKTYKANTLSSALIIPEFENAFEPVTKFEYEKVTLLGQVAVNDSKTVDQFQLRVSGPLCIGSVGFVVKSPSGMLSSLSIPFNIHYKSAISSVSNYGLGSYAFHDENSKGNWEIYAVSGNKGTCTSDIKQDEPLKVEYRIIPKLYS